MSDLMQAHQRLAELLLRHSCAQNIDVSDKALINKSLVQLSKACALGSSCLYLEPEPCKAFERAAANLPWLSLNAANNNERTVIVLQDGRLYLHKYFCAERSIEGSLKALVAEKHDVDEPAIKQQIKTLKYMSDEGANVIVNSLQQNLSVVTGGPGTGKTTIVVRVLALLIEQFFAKGSANIKIEILAPTGKAAARVKESIVAQKIDWLNDLRGFDKNIIEAIPETSQTVQKFLGINPTTRKSRFKHGHKANVDIVIVDEASMLDVLLVKELLAAIRPTTRLILLGDPYQLASVEAGNVLTQIVEAASESQNAWLSKACAELTKSHRFTSDSGIGQLAKATNEGDSPKVLELLQTSTFTDVSIGKLEQAVNQAIAGYEPYKQAIKQLGSLSGQSIEAVFNAFDQWQVFSPFRQGEFAVAGINQAVEDALGLDTTNGEGFYVGKPIIITSNDHALKLYNGDIGICLDKEGKTVCFANPQAGESGKSNYRHISTRILPAHDVVYAMTVHKSQGSEYTRCMLAVPEPTENQQALLTREILYTAITRAKAEFMLFAGEREVEQMVLNKTQRMSGLLK